MDLNNHGMEKILHARRIPEYKTPNDYPKHQRQTNPNISGIADLLKTNNNLFTKYTSTFPSPQRETEVSTKNGHNGFSERTRLTESQGHLVEWNPHEDIHSKSTNPYSTLFVGRLNYLVDEVELSKHFIQFGDISKIRIVKDVKTGKSKGYAFINFKSEKSVHLAFQKIGTHSNYAIRDRPIIVDIERGRTIDFFKPRRLGGGLGSRGYMEKYQLHKRQQKQIENQRKQQKPEPAPSQRKRVGRT